MTQTSEGRLERLRYLRKSLGAGGMLKRLLSKIVAPIYRSETGFITLTRLDDSGPSTDEDHATDSYGTECVVLTSPEQLNELADEILPPILLGELMDHLKAGPNRPIVLARRDNPVAPGKRAIGFKKTVRGQFTHFSGRLEGRLPDDTLMVTADYVIPECRGQRVAVVMRTAFHDYARKNGIRNSIGAVMSHNVASLRAHKHRQNPSDGQFFGPIKSIVIFGGLYSKATPFSNVLRYLQNPNETQCDPLGMNS
jgi:hypothetical protein